MCDSLFASVQDVDVTLPTDSKVGLPVQDFFTCSICINVVWDVEPCNECEALFCGKCIGAWLKKHSNCPLCKAVFKKGKARLAKLQLSEM